MTRRYVAPQGEMLDSERSDELKAIAREERKTSGTVEEMSRSFVRQAIQRGIFKPGERLQQDGIAAVLGTSRMPVRASLRQLESEGLVSFHPYRGATVRALTPNQIAEIYELRLLLETHALRRAIARITPHDVDSLAMLSKQIDALEAEESLAQRQLFYERLYTISDLPLTVEMIMGLRGQLQRYLVFGRMVEEPDGHEGLIALLHERNVEGASRWLGDHLAFVGAELRRIVAEDSRNS